MKLLPLARLCAIGIAIPILHGCTDPLRPDAVPRVTIVSPATGAVVTSPAVVVHVTIAHDTIVPDVTYVLNGVEKPALSKMPNPSETPPLERSFEVADLVEGANTIVVRAYDAAGKVGEAQVTVTVRTGGRLPSHLSRHTWRSGQPSGRHQ
jgi:hypothetical protein